MVKMDINKRKQVVSCVHVRSDSLAPVCTGAGFPGLGVHEEPKTGNYLVCFMVSVHSPRMFSDCKWHIPKQRGTPHLTPRRHLSKCRLHVDEPSPVCSARAEKTRAGRWPLGPPPCPPPPGHRSSSAASPQ